VLKLTAWTMSRPSTFPVESFNEAIEEINLAASLAKGALQIMAYFPSGAT
jgi:hypothetical protein